MLLDDFLRYVKIDTQSDDMSDSTPSTIKQFDLLNVLKNELTELGVQCEIDNYLRLYAFIPGNEELECVGLCAHVDTALECSGKDVKPQVIKDYNGRDIRLGDTEFTLSQNEFPKLNDAIGKTIITTDGTTLLGADDKAGVAIIMDAVRNILRLDPQKRRPCAILFTPDEEIGRGPEHFDPVKYKAKWAYTIDGADPKDISIESFNAKAANVTIQGKSIHPGDGKGKLINAILLMNEFIEALPEKMTPFYTEGREGFNHIVSVEGNVEVAKAHFILRNHDAELLAKQVVDFENAKKMIEGRHPQSKVEIEIKDQYRNMYEVISQQPKCKEMIEDVYNRLGIKFEYLPIRGGTDGATFSFLGCPCPNLGTGSYNHHSRQEFAILEEMEQMSSIATEIFKK